MIDTMCVSQDITQRNDMFKAAEKCIALRWPFALYVMPGEEDYRFIAGSTDLLDDDAEADGYGFMASFYNDSSSPATIDGSITMEEIFDTQICQANMGPAPEIHPVKESTPRLLHKAQVFSIVNDLKRMNMRGRGKAVLSRVISMLSDRSPLEVAKTYFATSPNAFRAIYYHPVTGLWITATPETLVDYDFTSCRLSTMALAGTREAGTQGEWDKKNLQEQGLVTSTIAACMVKNGIEPEISEVYTRNAGNVEHLCQDIISRTRLEPDRLINFVSELSPTPAVGGYPRAYALRLIDRLETHFRHCYAGWTGVEEETGVRLFVNLRCAMAEPVETKDEATGDTVVKYRYNVYCGGGILAASDPDAEWHETNIKSLPLCRAIDPAYQPEE